MTPCKESISAILTASCSQMRTDRGSFRPDREWSGIWHRASFPRGSSTQGEASCTSSGQHGSTRHSYGTHVTNVPESCRNTLVTLHASLTWRYAQLSVMRSISCACTVWEVDGGSASLPCSSRRSTQVRTIGRGPTRHSSSTLTQCAFRDSRQRLTRRIGSSGRRYREPSARE